MKRIVSVAVFTLIAILPLAAQSPKGWKVRVDRSMNASDPDAAGAIKFVTTPSGFHATNPQAAVYWNPANTASGSYTLKATFTQVSAGGHAEYYGLVFGGKDLEGPQQNYLYFIIAEEGDFQIKRRDGDSSAPTVIPKTPSDAIKKPDSSGKMTNTLEVRVKPDKIDYVINGTVVNSSPKTGMTANTDGIYGFRVNHRLEVEVDGFGVTKQ